MPEAGLDALQILLEAVALLLGECVVCALHPASVITRLIEKLHYPLDYVRVCFL